MSSLSQIMRLARARLAECIEAWKHRVHIDVSDPAEVQERGLQVDVLVLVKQAVDQLFCKKRDGHVNAQAPVGVQKRTWVQVRALERIRALHLDTPASAGNSADEVCALDVHRDNSRRTIVLVLSTFMVLASLALLVSASYAWFTDSVVSKGNVIKASDTFDPATPVAPTASDEGADAQGREAPDKSSAANGEAAAGDTAADNGVSADGVSVDGGAGSDEGAGGADTLGSSGSGLTDTDRNLSDKDGSADGSSGSGTAEDSNSAEHPGVSAASGNTTATPQQKEGSAKVSDG